MFNSNQQLTLNGETYRLLELIGAGGQCEVWKAERLQDKRFVAIRTVLGFYQSPDNTKTPQNDDNLALLIGLLQDEINLLGTFDNFAPSNGILPLLGQGTYRHEQWQEVDLPVMVQPFCPFGLSRYVQSHPNHEECTFYQWWNWFKQLIDALDYLHQKDPIKVHRDIKPDNILLDSHQRVALIDFGLARVWENNAHSNIPVGSASYMAPEQSLPGHIDADGKPAFSKSPAIDIYSTGLTFIALIYGEIAAHRLFVNNEALENRHSQALLSGRKGCIGKVGGMIENEIKPLQNVIEKSIQKTGGISELSQQDAAFTIVNLLQRMLLADGQARPTAAEIRANDIPLIDSILRQPRSQRLEILSIKADNYGKTGQGEPLKLTLELQGGGLSDSGDWLKILCNSYELRQGESWRRVDANGRPDSKVKLLNNSKHQLYFYVDLPETLGLYELDIWIEGLESQQKKLSCQCVVPFAQLWGDGYYERALCNEFKATEFEQYVSTKERKQLQPFLQKLLENYPAQAGIIRPYLIKEDKPIEVESQNGRQLLWSELLKKLNPYRKQLLVGTMVLFIGGAVVAFWGGSADDTKPIDTETSSTDNPDTENTAPETTDTTAKAAFESATATLKQWSNDANSVSEEDLQPAIILLEKYANNDKNLIACGWLGYYYNKKQQTNNALTFYQCAAEQGEHSAQKWLIATVMLNAVKSDGGEAYINRYYTKARQYAEELATAGDVDAMYYYGRILHDVDNIQDEGLRWLEQAAQQGSVPAQQHLDRIALAVKKNKLKLEPITAKKPKRSEEVDRYKPFDNGTVFDAKTGLMWQRCSYGQKWTGSSCSGAAKEYQWDEARQLTDNFAGYSDWRLPKIDELESLVYCGSGKTNGVDKYGRSDGCAGDYRRPTINRTVFPNTPENSYWSASPYSGSADGAWNVSFYTGGSNAYYNRSSGQPVRLVRFGQ